jgi:hypothetical protein
MLKKAIILGLFVASFFATTSYLQDEDSVTGLNWGPTLDVAHARGK